MPILLLLSSHHIRSSQAIPEKRSLFALPHLSSDEEMMAYFFLFTQLNLEQQELFIFLLSRYYKNLPYVIECIIKKHSTPFLEEEDVR